MFAFLAAILISSAAHADLSLVDYLNQAPRPIDAKLAIDEQHRVSSELGAAGGSLELKTSDGSVFRLTIPAGALDRPTMITMSEILSFTHPSLTLGQTAPGVQLSPDGLYFKKQASLKIIPAKPIAPTALVAMTADHDGRDVRLASLSPQAQPKPEAIELTLSHFSPYVVTGSQTLRETILKGFNRFASARIESWTANQIAKIKKGEIPDDHTLFEKFLTDAFENVVRVHAQSVESCEGGLDAQRTLLSWMRQGELLGFDHTTLAHENFKQVLVSKTETLCRERAREACYRDHRPFDVLDLAVRFERQKQLMGIENDSASKVLSELAAKCMRFEMVLDSTIGTDAPMAHSVTAVGKYEFWLTDIFGEWQNKGSVQVTSMKLDLDGLTCTMQSLEAPEASSELVKLFMVDLKFDQSLGVYIRDLYPPSVGHFSCTDDSVPPNTFPLTLPMGAAGPNNSYWGGMFLALHSQARQNEYNPEKNRYEIFKWDVRYGELFAVKEYRRALDEIKENTTIKIFHRPR